MGIFKNIFKLNRHNDIQTITQELVLSEKESAIYKSPIYGNINLHINEKSIESYVIAVILFEAVISDDFKQKFGSSTIQAEIKKIGRNTDITNFMKLFGNYYEGKPNLNKALNEISQYYIEIVWGLKKPIKDIILVTGYNILLSKTRQLIINYCNGIFKI